MNSAVFHFHGVTAHAAADPHHGRSALDAVELMNVGANYLREHVPTDVRIHYAITDGGSVPNVVPDRASVWYYVRAEERETVGEVYERLKDIAAGAALMTGTTVEEEFRGGCYPCLNNEVLGEHFFSAFSSVPRVQWTADELSFAQQISQNSSLGSPIRQEETAGEPMPPIFQEKPVYQAVRDCSSTDVGDVSHLVPCVMIGTAARSLAAPAHSWQVTACSGHSIGIKGMLYGAKVMAAGSVGLLEDPGMINRAAEEFAADTKGRPYRCPIPDSIGVPSFQAEETEEAQTNTD